MDDFSYQDTVKTKLPPKLVRRRRLLLIVPLVLVLLLFLYIVGYKASAKRREMHGYIQQTNNIANKSNEIAKDLEAQLTNPQVKSKVAFRTNLMDMVQECQYLNDNAENMIVPEYLQQAHSYFIMTMKLRHKGMELYKPPIFEAISSNSPKIKEKEIAQALKYLAFSDLAYKTYKEEMKKIMNGEDYGIKIVNSKFISGDNIFEKENIMAFLTKLKGENFQGSGDVAVLDVATTPLRVSINTDTEVRVLPVTDTVSVRIEVKNKSDKAQSDIPVEVELLTEGKTSGEKKQAKIANIIAGGAAKITVEDFSTTEGELNIFKIKVGPVYGEKNTDDNYYEYKFIMSNESQNQDQAQSQDQPSTTATD